MNDQTAEENKVVADSFHLYQQRNREEMRTHQGWFTSIEHEEWSL